VQAAADYHVKLLNTALMSTTKNHNPAIVHCKSI